MSQSNSERRPLWTWLVVALVLGGGLVVWAARSGDAVTGSAGRLTASSRSAAAEPGAGRSDSPNRTVASPGSAQSQGSLKEVPVHAVKTKPPVPMTGTGDFGTGLTLRLVKIEAVQGKALGPGEMAGPAVRFTLEATNDSAEPISLDGMVVAVDYGAAETPAVPLVTGDDPFPGAVDGGASVQGSYVDLIPPQHRGDVRIVASYSGKAPVVVLRGPV